MLLGDYLLTPTRKLDLAFVINDSPSMGPKRDKLAVHLPRMLDAFRGPNDRTLTSLRVAIFDGDLGSGGAITEGACGPRNGSILGDEGAAQIIGGPDCGMTDPGAHWIQSLTLSPANFSGDIIQVFACLAGGLAQSGCGYQQPLQALAISATDPGPASLPKFVRDNAYLGIIIISDQDDCSAFPNVGMLGSDLPGETAGLRCATRGHACGGQSLPYPTDVAFTSAFSDCSARADTTCAAGTNFSEPTSCTPLADIHALAEKVKALKPDPDNQILVAGIFGWPLTEFDLATAEYKIAPIPNPAHTSDPQAPPTLYDLWPVCYDPDHPPSNPDPATGYDATAAGYGARPGLRLSAFIDEFGVNGLKFSMCQPDWSSAMNVLGEAGPKPMRSICIDQELVDADPTTPSLDPDCIVEYLFPKSDDFVQPQCPNGYPRSPNFVPPGLDRQYTKTAFPRCDDTAPVAPCWEILTDSIWCPSSGQLLQVNRSPESYGYTPVGVRIRVQCRLSPGATSDWRVSTGCEY